MERNTFFCNLGLYIKSVLVFILLLGGSSSAWAQKDISGEGYFYGFEQNFATEGWTMTDCYNASYTATYSGTGLYNLSSGGYNGSNAFRFYGYSGYSSQCLISPELSSSTVGKKVVFHYKCSGTSVEQKFKVGYSTTDANISSFTNWDSETSYKNSTTWKTYETVFPKETKYIAVMYTSATQYTNLYLDDFEISLDNPYKTPTNFTLSSYDATSATFTWEREDDVTAFQMQYIKQGDADSTTIEIGDYLTTTLNDLITDKEYKAKLRSNYDGVHYSEWTEEITFTPRAEIETTINDGNSTNGYLPFYGTAANGITNSQFIIPSTSLGAVNGRQITKLVFYSNNANKTWGTAQFEVYIKETSNTTFSTADYDSWGTCVYNSASLSVDANKLMTINLSTPYNYRGGNLQIGFKLTKTGSSNYNSFYGVSGSNYTTVYGSGTTSESRSRSQFLPKVTITSVPVTTAPVQMDGNGFTTFASPYALDLTTANMPAGLTAYQAIEVDTEKSIVRFTSDGINKTVQANTGILLKGEKNTTYEIPVAEDDGDELDDNILLVNSTGGTFSPESGYTYFAMKKNSSPLTFGTFNPSTTAIPSNKAYLKVPSGSDARTLRFVFDDNETTGIKNVDAQKTSSKDIYFNLNGQRVAKPTKGMYISNGKKYIVK